MTFSRRVIITLVCQIVGLACTVGTSVLTARWLGPTGQGTLALMAALTAITVQIGNLGLPAAIVFFLGRDPSRIRTVARLVIHLGLVLGTVLGLALLPLYDVLWGQVPRGFALLAGLTTPFSLTVLLGASVFLSREHVLGYNVLNLLPRAGLLVLTVLVLAVLERGLPAAAAVTFLAPLGAAFIAIVATREWTGRLGLEIDPPGREGEGEGEGEGKGEGKGALLRGMLCYGFRAYLASLLGFLVLKVDLLLVNAFRGAGEAGLYSVAVGLGNLLYMLPVAIGTYLFPKVASDPEDDGSFTSLVVRRTALGMAVLLGGTALVSPWIIELMYGPAFAPSVRAFVVLLPGVLALSLSTLLMQDLSGRGLPPVVYQAPALALALNVALNLWWIPCWGAAGAAGASSVAYGLMFGMCWKEFRRTIAE